MRIIRASQLKPGLYIEHTPNNPERSKIVGVRIRQHRVFVDLANDDVLILEIGSSQMVWTEDQTKPTEHQRKGTINHE